MAMKRCPDCGEKYSDSYKYCPFCEEEEILRKEKPGRGGRGRRQGGGFSLLTPILIVLILVMAGILIALLRGDKQPTGSKDPVTPPSNVVTPVQPGETDSDPDGAEDPDAAEPDGTMPDEPDTTTPTTPATPAQSSDYEKAMALPKGLTLSTTDFTLRSVGETASIKASGGSGSYTWISEDDGIASVDSSGKVTAISKGTINIVVTDGSKMGVCVVRCNVSGTASTAPNTSGTSTPSSTGGGLKAGSGVVANAGGGVNVRPSAGTSGAPIASLKNGDEVQIIRSAGDGWYEITFSGDGGVETTGYMKGDYLANR